MADAEHSEKPTQRRLDRARKEGNFPASREFVSAVHFIGFVTMLASLGGAWLLHTATLMRVLLHAAFRIDLSPESLASLAGKSWPRISCRSFLQAWPCVYLCLPLNWPQRAWVCRHPNSYRTSPG